MKYILLALLLIQSACTFIKKKSYPSVLVIAVDSLKHDDISCANVDETRLLYGFYGLCQNSFKFNNAVTTSVLAAPAMASILTARYPHEHGLVHNGSQFLSAKIETIPEILITKKIRTSFFSGGAPIWRKLGFAQGFEVFNDYISINNEKLFRKASENVDLFLSWLKNINESFFSILYFPDLQFPETLDQSKEKHVAQRLEEIDEALGNLQKNLQSLNRWNDTIVILLGLNGRSKLKRPNELEPFELFADNFKVATFVKPQSERKDRGVNIYVENNINLVDIGNYILETYDINSLKQGQFHTPIDVKKIIDTQTVHLTKKRKLLIESAWVYWKLNGMTRFATLEQEKLTLNQLKNSQYDIWIDSMQRSPIDGDRYENYKSLKSNLNMFLYENNLEQFIYPDSQMVQKYLIASELWKEKGGDILDELEAYSEGNPEDIESKNWLAYWALKLKNWELLLKLSKELNQPVWRHVSLVNMNRSSNIKDTCWDLLNFEIEEHSCNDLNFVNLALWIKHDRQKSKLALSYKDRFIKLYKRHKTHEKIARLNWHNYNIWDVDSRMSLKPSLVDLALSISKFSKYKDML